MRWAIAVLVGVTISGVGFGDGGAADKGDGGVIVEPVSSGALPKDRTEVGLGEDVWLSVDPRQVTGTNGGAAGQVDWSITGHGRLMAYTGSRTLYRVGDSATITATVRSGGRDGVAGRFVVNGPGARAAGGKVEGVDFERDLGVLRMLENGAGTDIKRVREVAGELLKDYSAPEERGRIYEERLIGEAAAGYPDRGEAIEDAQQAAKLAPAPEDRVQAWMYRADAELLRNPGDAAGRAAAKEALLGAMNVVLGEEVPELLPELPAVSMDDGGAVAAEMEHAGEMEARKRAERARTLWLEREVVMDHLMELAGADGGAALRKMAARVVDTAAKRDRFEAILELWEERANKK
ncbi:MAG TPA: hypothetical protein VH253_18925 [Phycisphaerae bacterium]|nr:hypothetical protein [Phycisphaerae bacterium]